MYSKTIAILFKALPGHLPQRSQLKRKNLSQLKQNKTGWDSEVIHSELQMSLLVTEQVFFGISKIFLTNWKNLLLLLHPTFERLYRIRWKRLENLIHHKLINFKHSSHRYNQGHSSDCTCR